MSADTSDNKAFSQMNNLAGEAGSLQINSYIEASPISTVPDDRSMTGLFHKHGSYLQFVGGDALLNSKADFHYNIGGNVTYSILGDAQYTSLGQKHEMFATGGSQIHGDRSPEANKAQEDHQKSLDKITQAKIDAFKGSTKEVKCPTCNQSITDERASAILDKILGGLSQIWPPFMPFSYATFRKVLGGLVVPMLSIFTNKSATKSGTCNHPNCNGSTISVPDFDAANQAAKSAIESDSTIQLNEQKMGKQDTTHAQMVDNFNVRAGHGIRSTVSPYAKHKNNTNFPTALESNGKGLAQVCTGAPSEIAYFLQPDQSPVGNVHIDASHSMDLTSGSNGTHLHSDGPLEVKTGHVDIQTTQGDLNLFGKGFTQIKGKQVIIDAKDNSGDGGIHIHSDHTFNTGQLSVGGDLAVKGSVMMDGTLYAPNIVGKSMSTQTEPSASIQSVNHAPSWNSPPPFDENQQGTTRNLFSEALHAIKVAFDAITGELLTVTGLYNVVTRAINTTKMSLPVDNQDIPVGFGLAVNILGFTPLTVSKTSIATVTVPPSPANGAYAAPGTYAVVFQNTFVDPLYIPVWNGPHNHDNISGMHTHQHGGLEFHNVDSTAGFQSQRPSPNKIPTPCKGNGVGTSPADSGSLPLSICFGLGLGGGSGRGARNAEYGIEGEGDGTNGGNYVEAYPNYNEDGSLNPPPTLSPFRNC